MLRNPAPSLIKSVAFVCMAMLLSFPLDSFAQEGRKPISRPAPVYPEMAKKYGVKGSVKVEIVIAADGHVKETKILGGHPMLAAAVEDALKNWKYAPAAGESTAVLDFDFHP